MSTLAVTEVAGPPEASRRAAGRWRQLRRPSAVVALGWLVLVLVGAVFAPLIAPDNPTYADLSNVLSGPSGHHLLGTDALGYDVLSRLLYGARPALIGVAEAVAVCLVVGVPLGLVAGYLGGWADRLISRTADLVLAIPGLIVLLVVVSIFANNQTAAMLMFGLLGAPVMVRITRASTLGVRGEQFVDAARVSGLTQPRILRSHILPRIASTVIVQVSLFAPVALLMECTLCFLGVGPAPPQPSWGGAVYDASQVIQRDPWLLVPSGLVIALTILAFGTVGNALRDTSVDSWSPAQLRTRTRRSRRPNAAAAVAAGPAPALPPAGAPGLLTLDGLTVELSSRSGERVPIIQDVSFTIARGEAVGVVGESSCGKTMTARAVLGLLPADGRIVAGRCWFDGRDLTRLTPRELNAVRGREIGFVAQEPMVSLDPTCTVGGLIAEAVRHHCGVSRSRARKRAVELLASVRLPDPAGVARRYPHQLSGGMAQRAAIALALAGDPALLIADEPTTALDVTVQDGILGLLHQLRRDRGLSILLISHDWGVVTDVCDRIVVMYAGQVVEQGATDALFAQPRHPYTEGLLAANPHLSDPMTELVTIPGTVPEPADWPTGCHFHPRCPYATHQCTQEAVPLVTIGPGNISRCLHIEQVGAAGGRHAS
jgi:peptide/nickel transport system permease protein